MKKIGCFVVLGVREFETKILIKGVHLTNFENKCSIESWYVYEER